MSEALILVSVNPKYDNRLFVDLQLQEEKIQVQNMLCTKIVCFFCFDIQDNICTQHVVNLYFTGNSMNNLSLYCGLTDSRMRASDIDLAVLCITI